MQPSMSDDAPVVDVDEEQLHPRFGNTVFDTYAPQPIVLEISEEDGLPDLVVQHYAPEDVLPPSLNEDTLVCLAQPERHLPVVGGQPGEVKVYPALAKCVYYKRSKVRDTDIGQFLICRFCTNPNLKGVNGAAMDLRDTSIPCCEFRDPPDVRSEEEMDRIDEEKIAMGRNRVYYPITMTAEQARAKRLAKTTSKDSPL
jgi:hypothetical protein